MSLPAPLSGRRIVVTRAEAQAESLVKALEALGAEIIPVPLIRIAPPADPRPLQAAARDLAAYDWVIFSSANAVTALWHALDAAGLAELPSNVRVCAVGAATEAAVRARGGTVALVPRKFTAEAVVAAFRSRGEDRGSRILLPLAQAARDTLEKGISELGAVVDRVEAYRTLRDDEGVETLRNLLRNHAVHMVTLTSGSTARSLVEAAGADLGATEIASIGPVTTAVAGRIGLHVDVEAQVHTAEGLAAAIADHYGSAAASG